MVSQIPNIPSFLEDQSDNLTSHENKEVEKSVTNKKINQESVNIEALIRHEFQKVTLSLKTVLTFDECVEYTGLSKGYLYKLTHAKQIPYCKPCGKKIYFSREEIDSWLLSNRVMTTNEVQSYAKEKVDHLNRDLRSKG